MLISINVPMTLTHFQGEEKKVISWVWRRKNRDLSLNTCYCGLRDYLSECQTPHWPNEDVEAHVKGLLLGLCMCLSDVTRLVQGAPNQICDLLHLEDTTQRGMKMELMCWEHLCAP